MLATSFMYSLSVFKLLPLVVLLPDFLRDLDRLEPPAAATADALSLDKIKGAANVLVLSGVNHLSWFIAGRTPHSSPFLIAAAIASVP